MVVLWPLSGSGLLYTSEIQAYSAYWHMQDMFNIHDNEAGFVSNMTEVQYANHINNSNGTRVSVLLRARSKREQA